MLFGLHAVESLILHQPERILRLYIQQDRRQDKKILAITQLAQQLHLAIDYVPKQTLERMTHAANHQGIAAECTKLHTYSEADLTRLLSLSSAANNIPLLLILDGVQDPHNLGACFRSADAAGVCAIIAPKDKSVGITPTVSKVASGAAERVPFVQVTNLVRTLEDLKAQGIWIYGAAAEAEQTVYQTNLTGPSALVLGAEGAGLRRLTREHCDVLLKIPMRGSVASLNVSVATGVLLFEIVRQRSK